MPVNQPRKEKYPAKLNRQRLDKKLKNWTVSEHSFRLDIFTDSRKFILAKTLEGTFAKVNSLYFAICSARESFLL